MNILILEDDFLQQRRIETTIEKYKFLGIKDIFLSSNPDKIIAHADQKSDGNVYFLDLEIDGIRRAGFETAARIREKDLFGPIIFVTTHSEMMPVTFEYQVSALDFVAKDLAPEAFETKIKSCLEKASAQIKTLSNDHNYFVFKNKYCSWRLPFNELLYFETSEIPHKLRVISATKEMEFYADLKEIEDTDERFFRCHRSYILNLEQIRAIHKKERKAEFKSGKSCLISRKYMRILQEKLNESI